MHVDIPYKSYGWKPPYTDKVIKYDSVKNISNIDSEIIE